MATNDPFAPPREAYRDTVAGVLSALATEADRGLTSTDARARLESHGANRLKGQPRVPAWRRFLGQFADGLVLLLVAAALISVVLWLADRQTTLPYDAIVILGIVLLNAAIGHVQQTRAEGALSALHRMAAPRATVIRDGNRQVIASDLLVPGDIILIEEGDIVSADARLVEAVSLRAAEASLTGESAPVSKHAAPIAGAVAIGDRRNMLFSGTSVTRGHGAAVVTATGMRTEMGRIAGMLETTRDEMTPLQLELGRAGRFLGVIVIILALVIVGAILLVSDINDISGLFDVLILGIALAVAAVPEGLPAIVTAVLALGVQRMAKRNAIVRRLAAVETLGSADIICSDKTGTLTRNEMTVRQVVTASGTMHLGGTGYAPEGRIQFDGMEEARGTQLAEIRHALSAASLANNAALVNYGGRWSIEGDPTEGALIVAARKAGLDQDMLNRRFTRIGEVPFSSERKLMSTIHADAERQGRVCVFVKGAPDVLLTRCSCELVGEETRPLTALRRAEIVAANETLASAALRTIGVACRMLADGDAPQDGRLERNLIFVGLIGMIDPPRDEAREAVACARAAGIRPVMITGDHPRTAMVIARELGITEGAEVVSGAEIQTMDDQKLDRVVRDVSVYARVDPAHKLRLVTALQKQSATVAMTGDGVNDAPALKAADIGIAMGMTGTDVSRQAADIVLADDNFASIVAAVEEGRVIFSNIRKFLRYLLSSNVGEVMTMFLGVLLSGPIGLSPEGNGLVLPLLATQVLWINLVTDGAPALALGVDPPAGHVMGRPPRPRGQGIVTRRMWGGIVFVGAVMAVGTLGILDASLPGGMIDGTGSARYGQTMAFTTLTLFQLFNVFNARSDECSAFDGLFANPWLWGGVGLSLGLHAAAIYAPFLQAAFSTVGLSARDWLFCAAIASSVLWLRELQKLAVAWHEKVLRRDQAVKTIKS